MATSKRKVGRPVGIKQSERVELRISPGLRAYIDESVRKAGVPESQWWRRAARAYVLQGAPEVAPFVDE